MKNDPIEILKRAGSKQGEAEVTPEMIEAGMEVVWRTDITDPRETELHRMVSDIFRRMLTVSKECHHEVV
jgi:hypothetical protein